MFKFNNKYSEVIIYTGFIVILIILMKIVEWLNNDIGFMKGSKYTLGIITTLILILGIYLIKLFYSISNLIKDYLKSKKKS
jgi:hypothetical protein